MAMRPSTILRRRHEAMAYSGADALKQALEKIANGEFCDPAAYARDVLKTFDDKFRTVQIGFDPPVKL